MRDRFVIRGRAVTPDGVKRVAIGVSDGIIIDVAAQTDASPLPNIGENRYPETQADTADHSDVLPLPHADESRYPETFGRITYQLDASKESLLIFPGFFDIHTHAREFPISADSDPTVRQAHAKACAKETFETAGMAALNGGVTMYAAMPNDAVPPDNQQTYEAKQTLAQESPCPVITYAVITHASEPWADLPHKVYLDDRPSVSAFTDWDSLETAMARYKGRRVFFHAEDPEILRNHAGPAPRWITRPPEAEISAVEHILELTAKFGLNTHFCHISTRKAVELIHQYNKNSTQKVTCEAVPMHLFFSIAKDHIHAALPGLQTPDKFLGCNPPIRSEEDRLFTIEALRTGLIDILATDHAPHTLEDKTNGAPGGPQLDTVGPLVGWLMKDCGYTPTRVAEMFSDAPGKLFVPELSGKCGEIRVGKASSFTIMDLDDSITVGDAKGSFRLRTKCGWSPLSGITLPAKVVRVIVNGIDKTQVD